MVWKNIESLRNSLKVKWLMVSTYCCKSKAVIGILLNTVQISDKDFAMSRHSLNYVLQYLYQLYFFYGFEVTNADRYSKEKPSVFK